MAAGGEDNMGLMVSALFVATQARSTDDKVRPHFFQPKLI